MSKDEYWKEYERRVQSYEDEGCTRSDAQSIVDVEFEQENLKID